MSSNGSKRLLFLKWLGVLIFSLPSQANIEAGKPKDVGSSPDLCPCMSQAPPSKPEAPWFPSTPFLPPIAPLQPESPPQPPPTYCPELPPYPGITSIQILECNIELPQPEVCGLGVLNSDDLILRPGQVLAVEFSNLNSTTATLSRLVVGAEQLHFNLLVVSGPPVPRLFLATGFCFNQSSLAACLHDAYHGLPAYRSACQACFGMSMVSELEGFAEGFGWSGSLVSRGDTSYFRAQLLEGAQSSSGTEVVVGGGVGEDGAAGARGGARVMYFMASMSTGPVGLVYARSARLLYRPGAAVSALPPINASFSNVTHPAAAAVAPANGGDGGDGGSSSSSNKTGPSPEKPVDSLPGGGSGGGPVGNDTGTGVVVVVVVPDNPGDSGGGAGGSSSSPSSPPGPAPGGQRGAAAASRLGLHGLVALLLGQVGFTVLVLALAMG